MRHFPALIGFFLLPVLVACGEADDSSPQKPPAGTLSGETPCERWSSLRPQVEDEDCDLPDTQQCMIPQQCAEAAERWLVCVASDLTQCLCEADGSLNCEGSFKADEGPARCIGEYQVFEDCLP
jgi:hypothetical protein